MTIADTPELRRARIRAYRAGAYRFRAPPVCTVLWDEEAWINYVTFNDETLRGFMPYDAQAHRIAQAGL